MTRSRVTARDAALLLVNPQVNLVESVTTIAPELLRRNLLSLARCAVEIGIPSVVSTNVDVPGGRLLPELAEICADAPTISRAGVISAWAHPEVREAIRSTGRSSLIVAGFPTEVGLVHTALDAAEDLVVQAVIDASGSFYPVAQEMALRRMQAAGVTLTATLTVLAELACDWSTPEGERMLRLAAAAELI